jgi:hypothetical protein
MAQLCFGVYQKKSNLMDLVFIIFMGFIALTIFLWDRDRKQQLQKPAEIDIAAIADSHIEALIGNGEKVNVIKLDLELTEDGLKKAPELRLQDGGIRDLIDDGRIEEAIEIYQKFAGVDEYTARDAVEEIKRQGTHSD